MKPRKMPLQRFCDETLLATHVDFAAMHLDAAKRCAKALREPPEVWHLGLTPDEARTINLRRALRCLARFRHCEKCAQAVIARLQRKARR